MLVDHPDQQLSMVSTVSSEFVQSEWFSRLSGWLVVNWNDCFVVLKEWPSEFHSSFIRRKLVINLVSSDISVNGIVFGY